MPATSLTPAQIEKYCSDLLEPISRKMLREMGQDAADATGECLLKALRAYNTTLTASVNTWAYSKTRLLVIEALRSLHGRKGTARYAAHASQSSLDGPEGAVDVEHIEEPGNNMERLEGLQRALRNIEKGTNLQRCILLGKVLGNFTNDDLKGLLLDVSQAQIYSEVAAFRELVSLN